MCHFRKVEILSYSNAVYYYKENQDPIPIDIGEKAYYIDLVENNNILDGYEFQFYETIDNSIDFSDYDSPGSIMEHEATTHYSGYLSLKVDCSKSSTMLVPPIVREINVRKNYYFYFSKFECQYPECCRTITYEVQDGEGN